ncbi:MAG: Hsp20/alpha crystallin family protein [Anaerolineae bacterium]|nr:Hsp20/alpha crystallin family protein [Anaerolineae bacterium]
MSEQTNMEIEKQEVITDNGERTHSRRAFVPHTDIYETTDAIFVVADMPGVNDQSVDITLEKNILSIQGLVEPIYPDGYSVAYAEYEDGDFQRKFTLNNQIDQDRIEATLREGVLRLKLPKIVPTQRKISVNAG